VGERERERKGWGGGGEGEGGGGGKEERGGEREGGNGGKRGREGEGAGGEVRREGGGEEFTCMLIDAFIFVKYMHRGSKAIQVSMYMYTTLCSERGIPLAPPLPIMWRWYFWSMCISAKSIVAI